MPKFISGRALGPLRSGSVVPHHAQMQSGRIRAPDWVLEIGSRVIAMHARRPDPCLEVATLG